MGHKATFVCAVGSIGYLITRKDKWDIVGDAAVELAVLFGAMVLITGPLWGRKAWGAYWVWDVRLTSSLVLKSLLSSLARLFADTQVLRQNDCVRVRGICRGQFNLRVLLCRHMERHSPAEDRGKRRFGP